MASKTFNYVPIVAIPPIVVDNKVCSAVSCMNIVNNDFYVLSTYSPNNIDKQPIVMYKAYNYIPNINEGTMDYSIIQTKNGSKSIAKHLNSMTYNNHLFYAVTRNGTDNENQVMAFGSDGVIKQKIKYSHSGSKIATINHYRDNQFIISCGGGDLITYRLVELVGNQLNDLRNFKIQIPKDKAEDYQTGNDSFYDKKTKRLYVTKFKGDLTSNAIFVYDLSVLDNKTYNATDRYYIKPIYGESKFEIEGLGIYNDEIYVCTNSVLNGQQVDGVYKLI